MATTYNHPNGSIGVDAESLQSLSFTDVNLLLRILSPHDADEERTFSSVTMFPIADGKELYIQPH